MAARRSDESPVVTTDDIKKETEPVAEKGYTVVVGPSGHESKVPDSILQTLLDSGYTKK